MRVVGRGAAFALASAIAFSQAKPDAAEIVRKMAATYATTTQYEFAFDGNVQDFGIDGKLIQETPIDISIAVRGPDHARVEGILGDLGPHSW